MAIHQEWCGGGRFVGAAVIAAALFGCSASTPSEADGEKRLAAKIERESGGRIKLVSFRKTNGQSREMFGVKMYSLEWDAEFEFTQDSNWRPKSSVEQQLLGPFFEATAPIKKSPYDITNRAANNIERGQRRKVSGAMDFELAENGWKPSGFRIGD